MQLYFAYGSNMNLQRVQQRGLQVERVERAWLPGYRLAFDKHAAEHAGAGHACISWHPGATVEGVLYWLADPSQIQRMDVFERTPVNYSREAVGVETGNGRLWAWTYFANPAVLRPGLRPPRAYLAHLLAGQPYLSTGYHARLSAWPCVEDAR